MACADSGHGHSDNPYDHAERESSCGEPGRRVVASGENEPSALGRIVAGLRSGELSLPQAVRLLQAYRDSIDRPLPEPSTETIRNPDGTDGRVRLQYGTAENDEDRPGERTISDESGRLSRRERQFHVLVRATGAVLPSAEKFVSTVQDGLVAGRSYAAGSRETTSTASAPSTEQAVSAGQQVSTGQQTPRTDDHPTADLDAGDAMSATLTAIVATVVLGQRAAEKLHSTRKPKPPRRGPDDSDPAAGGDPARPTRR